MYHIFVGYGKNPISRSRKQLLDPNLFELTVPRCYLYSNSDPLVMWQDIYEHASDLIKRDGCVTEVIFEESEHVNHARTEPKRYWDTVRTVWMHSQEQHGARDIRNSIRDLRVPELSFKERITIPVVPVVERSPIEIDTKRENERFSVLV